MSTMTMRTPKSNENSATSPRSSVLERAREYNRRIEQTGDSLSRSKSLDRGAAAVQQRERSSNINRSQSAGRERAMQSVQKETAVSSSKKEAPPKEEPEKQEAAVVTPELLVDALSGHEDGLLAIAEKLMEHYDGGYNVMGEAIIDAFADVQKLFQHVVEAAHMEGAAFEASRRETEMQELRQQISGNAPVIPQTSQNDSHGRHDEFIDEDVKEVLTQAIRKGAPLREANNHSECFELYEQACQSASALLPVDSDHRGRLQLSIARSESMSADRACAILRYAMDDVLRSGLTQRKLPDPSQRSDNVLPKPKDIPSLNGEKPGVVQSSEEALASLVEELKEVLGAPVYDNTPLQSVAQRFWVALSEAQKTQLKNEEKLEQSLGKLKGEYLLARAEWEEKLTMAQETAEAYKKKYMSLKDATRSEKYMDQARLVATRLHEQRGGNHHDDHSAFDSVKSSRRGGPGSVASLGSGLAKSIAGSFNCAGENERSNLVVEAEMQQEHRPRSKTSSSSPDRSSVSRTSSRSQRSKSSKSFREV